MTLTTHFFPILLTTHFINVTYFQEKRDIQWRTKITSLNTKVKSSLNYIQIKVISEADTFS